MKRVVMKRRCLREWRTIFFGRIGMCVVVWVQWAVETKRNGGRLLIRFFTKCEGNKQQHQINARTPARSERLTE